MLQDYQNFAERVQALLRSDIKGNKDFDFDLCYLGQSVGTIKVENGVPLLTVDEEKALRPSGPVSDMM